jgi:uncharacterized protein YjiS (DUF1127 family)
MDTGLWHAKSVQGGLVTLEVGEVLRLPAAAGRHVGVVQGNVWVTQQGDLRDRVLSTGESLRLERDGLSLLVPLGGLARVVLEDGLVAQRAAQVGASGAEALSTPTTPDPWIGYTPEFERAVRQLRARAIAELMDTFGKWLKAAGRRLVKAVAASVVTRRTARELRALSDHTLKDLGLRRDQIDCVARRAPC